jgi:hypothetical protein
MEFDHDARDALVGHLKFELARGLDLGSGPLCELDLAPHVVKRTVVAILADELLGLLAGHRVVDAAPIRIAGSVPLDERAWSAGQQQTGRFNALFQLGILRAVGQLLAAVSTVRHCRHIDYPTKLRFRW